MKDKLPKPSTDIDRLIALQHANWEQNEVCLSIRIQQQLDTAWEKLTQDLTTSTQLHSVSTSLAWMIWFHKLTALPAL